MKQVIVIHGGTVFENYDDYFNSLSTKSVKTDRLTYKPLWKELLQENLGSEYQVLLPSMPNKTNARYSEWAAWFKNLTQVFEDDCVLVGHSLGGIFLAKYLSENTVPVRIKGTVLIAAPFNDESTEDLGDFKLTEISELLIQQAGRVTLFFGHDDPVIAPVEIDQYKKYLPNATFNVVSAPDHFMRVELPELINTIKEL